MLHSCCAEGIQNTVTPCSCLSKVRKFLILLRHHVSPHARPCSAPLPLKCIRHHHREPCRQPRSTAGAAVVHALVGRRHTAIFSSLRPRSSSPLHTPGRLVA